MRARVALVVGGLAIAPPAWADKKLDPDPAFLAKARTAATATVEAHYDISEKAPFPARFMVCAGQLTAARDEGRALPLAKEEIDRLIGAYRKLALELQAHRAKVDVKAAGIDIDAEIAKVRSDAMQFLPGDTTRLGVDRMKKLHGERLAFCQLTRDWYETQNGLRIAASPADQQKFAKQEAEQRARDKATSAPAPLPPAIKPSTVQLIARAAAPASPPPTVKVVVPSAGTPAGGDNARDARVGLNISHADARAEFAGRPLWSALAECVARMDLIQARGGGATRVQSEGYAKRAAYILWGSRGDVGGKDLSAMAGPVAQERARLGPRVAASWDEHRQRTGQLPLAAWGQTCHALEQYAAAEAQRIVEAKRAQAQRDHAEVMKRFNAPSSASSGGSSSGGGYSSSSGNNSLDAAAAASRAAHQATMQRYERENRQIRQEIKAIDRKYGR